MKKIKLTLKMINAFKTNHVSFISELISQHGTAVALTTPFFNLHVLANPEHIKQVLFGNYTNYVRPPNPIINAILQDSGMQQKKDQEKWKAERFVTLNPILNTNSLRKHNSAIIEIANEEIEGWKKYIDDTKGIPIQSMISAMTVRNLAKILFSDYKLNPEHLTYQIQELFYLIGRYEMAVTKLAWKFSSTLKRRSNKLIQDLNKLTSDIVTYCLSEAAGNNMVKALATQYSISHPANDQQLEIHLAGRVAAFLLGGFESNTNNLIWVLNYLSMHPEISKKVYQELQTNVGARKLESDDIDRLPYMRATILEILRLATKAFIPRLSMQADNLSGHVIEKNDRVILPVFYMHHLTEYWENPEALIPERFLSDLDERYRFVYLAFSAGPRGCIGKEFAMIQIMIMLSIIMQRYRVYLPALQTLDPNFQYLDPATAHEIRFILKNARDY